MTPERWHQIQDVFHSARELPAESVAEFLAHACAEDEDLAHQVQALLEADLASANPLDRPVASLTGAAAVTVVDENLGQKMGSYRLERLLGRGGMGSVYLAVRADGAYLQQAAVKILRRGLDTDDFLHRFRQERQILAGLDHPHIAKLLDGGSTPGGVPFLVMEYVDGKPLHHYCDQLRLTLKQRLELFRKICRAVHVAHQNLVVHRDLKPGNILVTEEGEPKLLDFSIAKLLAPSSEEELAALTQQGTALMTPAYASPEQLRGEVISTASDVYSLGVVLFELLAGCRPGGQRSGDQRSGDGRPAKGVGHQGPLGVANRRESALPRWDTPVERLSTTVGRLAPPAREEVADKRRTEPNRLHRQLRGDLDNIVAMALRSEPQRRYSSADQMAKDLERHLAGHAVLASGDSWVYRGMKLLRRHRLAAAVAAISLAALLGFVVLLVESQRQALRHFERAESVSDLLVALFEIPDPGRARGNIVTARQILEDGVLKVRSELSDQPQAQADVEASMGRSFLNLGLLEEAEELLQHSLDLRRGLQGEDHSEVGTGLLRLSEVFEAQGRYPEAAETARKAVEVHRGGSGEGHEETAGSHLQLARVLDLQGNFQDADDEFRRGLSLARELGASRILASGLDDYAISLARRGQTDQAEDFYREALEILRGLYGGDHPEVALSLNNLGLLLKESDVEAAEELFREAEQMQRRLYPEGHLHLATTLSNLGLSLDQAGRLEESEAFYLEALEMQRKAYHGDHPRLATTLNNLAALYLDQGRREEAEDLYRQSLAMRQRTLGERHEEVAASLNNLGEILAATGRQEQARDLYVQALEITRSQLGEEHFQVAIVLNNLGGLAKASGDLAEAEELYERSLAVMTAALGEDHPRVGKAVHNLATVRWSLGEVEKAEQSFRRALEIFRRRLGEEHLDVGRVLASLAALRGRAGDAKECLDLAVQARDILHDKLAASSPWRLTVERSLGESLFQLNRYDEAKPHLELWYQGLLKTRGPDHPQVKEARKRLQALASPR
ncbi:MAG: serine/threonine-protein kinase [Deltaproteobacteria bacterium]|nr:serine/threonine-protein kinase [Deltaproteobacteria bacterium]